MYPTGDKVEIWCEVTDAQGNVGSVFSGKLELPHSAQAKSLFRRRSQRQRTCPSAVMQEVTSSKPAGSGRANQQGRICKSAAPCCGALNGGRSQHRSAKLDTRPYQIFTSFLPVFTIRV
ncbi:MAG: hypothetical protein ABI379_11505, partial [Rhodanobacter sp.]